MKTQMMLCLLVGFLVSVPLSSGAGDPVRQTVANEVGDSADGPTIQSVNFVHNDCVGPGLPLTAGPHATHTTNVPGFVLDPAKVVTFRLTTITPFGAGICPTTAGGPVLPQDFTGRYQVMAVCQDTLNPGTINLNWIIDAVAGIVVAQGAGGTACSDFLNDPFSLDVTVTISSTTFLGVTLQPVGGILLTVTQA